MASSTNLNFFNAFLNICRRFSIKYNIKDDAYIEFNQADFFALLDLYTLCSVMTLDHHPRTKHNVVAYRTAVLDPSLHLLSTFIRLAEGYEIMYRFDQNAQTIQIQLDSFLQFAQDTQRFYMNGGDVTLC